MQEAALLLVLMPAALASVVQAVTMSRDLGVGWDAHAYWAVDLADPYWASPGTLDAFNYSPLFAQALQAFTWLPWPVFAVLVIGAAGAAVVWLAWPLSWVPRMLLVAVCATQVASGNIDWLVALLLVVGGTTRGPGWLVAASSKVTSCVGPLWFLARGQWRPLAWFAGVLVVAVSLSWWVAPELWRAWFDFLRDSGGGRPGMFQDVLPPLWVRASVAMAVTVFAARTSRSWLLAVAILVATPVPGTGTWAVLAAVPRLLAQDARRRTEVER